MSETEKRVIKYSIWTIAILLLLTVFNPLTIVRAGEKGIMLNFGAVSDKVLDEGLHFRIPFYQSIKKISIQPKQLDHKIEVGKDGAITKDNQTIGANLTVFYRYKPKELPAMYKQYGEDTIKSVILQTLRESFKSLIGDYDIFKLPTVQEEIRNKAFEDATAKLANYPIELTELKVVNYDWSDEFDTQIKATMDKAQQVKQKEQELLIAQNEQQKKVKEAEAEKQALITKAEGEKEAVRLHAEAKELEGEGIRKYNDSIAKNWDIELRKMQLEIDKIKAENWDGKYVPNNMYGTIPFSTGGVQGQ